MDICSIYDGSGERVLEPTLNSKQAFPLILEQAKELVKRVIETRGNNTPPFLPEEFAALKHVTRIAEADLGKASGLLLKMRSGYLIKVNQNHHPVRKSFSCAHEIGHILFNELKLERYVQNIEYRTYNPQGETRIRSKVREHLCDAVATELLMPEQVFLEYLSSYGLSVNSVEQLAKVFRVSIPATAIRIAEISERPCIAVLWKDSSKYKPKTLRAAWYTGPGKELSMSSRYSPVTKQVEGTSSIYKAYLNDNTVISHQLFKSGNLNKNCRVESKRFGYNENRYVISLAFPDPIDCYVTFKGNAGLLRSKLNQTES
jgi:Zn-dependent peptidase ImmA (M78 family)